MENSQSLAVEKFLGIAITTTTSFLILFHAFKKRKGGKETDVAATLESTLSRQDDDGASVWDVLREDDGDVLREDDGGASLFYALDESVPFSRMTREEWRKYEQEKAKTGGFDVDVPPNVTEHEHGVIHPFLDWELKEGTMVHGIVKECSEFAIDSYNNKNKTAFKFEKIIRSSMELCCILHYITFEAKKADQTTETFQAIVFGGVNISEIEVKLCRIKPKN
ncbi:hypothetical protein Vadar_005631 [Vaccinium darrowii]|uniref:Uncharacterized protein n=1 Tax=Vaccinium darrowii TaxID=229202 RepID=A0ACB7WY99_9ERIC|nr:hypothetical protein Vadar_005631 [Vaccinium darrowii]